MSFWTLLDGGMSMPTSTTPAQRFALRMGRWLATRHDHVTIHERCRISPEARIHPRNGQISIGADSTVALGAIIQGNVRIGSNSSVQAYTMLVGYETRDNPTGQITIGDNVRIAPHVLMFGANHNFDDPTRPIHGQGLSHAPITIEDDVWIASRVVITAGVTIGQGCVVAAGAVVTHTMPPYSVIGGVPARILKMRGTPN